MTVSSASREQVTRTLRDVFDPELGMSVVDLGLIYGVEIDGAGVRITMTLTTQGCPLHDSMTDWIRQAGDRAHVGGDPREPILGQLEAVEQARGQTGVLALVHVLLVCLQDLAAAALERLRHRL